jgi:hypothetical protein
MADRDATMVVDRTTPHSDPVGTRGNATHLAVVSAIALS